jgi:hypothetical protein
MYFLGEELFLNSIFLESLKYNSIEITPFCQVNSSIPNIFHQFFYQTGKEFNKQINTR